MQLAILRSGGDPCDTCGQHQQIAVVHHPDPGHVTLRVPLADLLPDHGAVPWWRPVKRRIVAALADDIAKAEQDLLAKTIFPVA